MPRVIAIALGDVAGIGPEITVKAIAAELDRDDTRYLVVGNQRLFSSLSASQGVNSPRIEIHDPGASGNPAQCAMAYLKAGAELCLAGKADALVTAPVNKEAIVRAGFPKFVGQTEYLSELAGSSPTAMMLLGADERDRWLRVALATTHVPLRDVARTLSAEKIELAIELAAQACSDLGLPRAKIAVCGLNPHAGEGGHLGDEEQTTIRPAVERCQSKGIEVAGPFAADALFYHVLRGDYDAVVAMYHDQGLVPLKMIGFERGVNWTLGLPFIRTSPDHGTAYDIAGKNKANPSSMIEAIHLAKRLVQRPC
jgi:4-hydroxythreonine-4-phosphate dehydrogenase